VPSSMNFLLQSAEEPYRSLLPSINLPRSSATSSDGRIRLCDLYPGRFQLIAARLGNNEQEFLSATDITITNSDVRNLVIAAMPRTTVAVEFGWDNPGIVSSTTTPIIIRTFPSPVRVPPRANPTVPGVSSLDAMSGIAYIPVISGLDSRYY